MDGSCFSFRQVPIDQAGHSPQSRNNLSFIPQPPIAGAVATPFTVAGIPSYERSQMPLTNNYCRFPPVLLESPNSDHHRMNSTSPHKWEVEFENQMVTEQVSLFVFKLCMDWKGGFF